MKRLFIVVFSILAFTVGINKVYAECKDTQSNSLFVNADVINIDNGEDTNVRIDVSGLTEDLYVVVMNDYNDTKRTYYYADTEEGKFSFYTDNVNRNINYVIRVYSVDSTCSTEPLNTISIKTPRFNPYSVIDVCHTSYYIELCDAFYDIGDMTINEFNEKVSSIIEEKSKPFSKKVGEFISKYYLYVLIPFLLIITIYVVRIIILKRGKKDE